MRRINYSPVLLWCNMHKKNEVHYNLSFLHELLFRGESPSCLYVYKMKFIMYTYRHIGDSPLSNSLYDA